MQGRFQSRNVAAAEHAVHIANQGSVDTIETSFRLHYGLALEAVAQQHHGHGHFSGRGEAKRFQL